MQVEILLFLSIASTHHLQHLYHPIIHPLSVKMKFFAFASILSLATVAIAAPVIEVIKERGTEGGAPNNSCNVDNNNGACCKNTAGDDEGFGGTLADLLDCKRFPVVKTPLYHCSLTACCRSRSPATMHYSHQLLHSTGE